MNGDVSTVMRTSDRALLREYLGLTRELQRAPATLRRLRSHGWSLPTLSTLSGLSLDEVTEKLRESR